MLSTGILPEDLEALRRIDSCTLANAIEVLNVRPRNEGFTHSEIPCRFPRLPPVVGYAVTGTVRSAAPPIGGRCYYDHIEWWRYLESVPSPRIVVLQDLDEKPGVGALFGELHARICMALNCVAHITNGAVRDLPAIERLGFQLFASHLSVSHAYAHVVDFGEPIEIGGLPIRSGDLLHADLHGVQTVPFAAVKQLPAIASDILSGEQVFIQMGIDGNFSVERLAAEIRAHAEAQKCK